MNTLDAARAVAFGRAGAPQNRSPLLETRVRDAKLATLGADHPGTLSTTDFDIAVQYWSTKQLDKSVPLFENLLKWNEAKLGRQHYETQRMVGNLGVNYKDSGRVDKAIPHYSKRPTARGIDSRTSAGSVPHSWKPTRRPADRPRSRSAGPGTIVVSQRKDCPRTARTWLDALAQSSVFLLQIKAYTDAETILRECLAVREKTQPDLWSTFSTKSMLGGALLGQKKYTEAEPLLVAGYQMMKRREATIPPFQSDRLTEATEPLPCNSIRLPTSPTKRPNGARNRRPESRQ